MQKEVVDLTGFSPEKVKKLAELKLIEFDGKHYNEGTVKQYMNYELKILNNCYDIDEFTKIAKIPKYTGLHNIELHYPDEFPLLNIIKPTLPINGKYVYIVKDSALDFKAALDIKRAIFLTHLSTNDLNRKYGLGFAKIKYYTEIRKLNPIKAPTGFKKRGLYFPIKEVETLVAEEKNFLERHYPFSEVKKLLGYAVGSLSSIMELVKAGYLTLHKTDFRLESNGVSSNTHWITKESLHLFLELLENDYIKLDYIIDKLKLTPKYLTKIFSSEDKLIINYQTYIKKVKALQFMKEYELDSIPNPNLPYEEQNYYTLKIIEKLSLRKEKTLYSLLQKSEYKNLFIDFIEPIDNEGDWKLNKIEVNDYLEMINDLRKKYYTRPELQDKLNLQKTFKNIPITAIEMPLFMKFFKSLTGKYLYDKQEALRFLENKELFSLVFEQLHLDLSDYIKNYIELREIPDHLEKTAELLKSFAEKYLSTKQASPDTSDRYKREYLISIEYLINYNLKKELFHFDNAEVQLFIYNCPSTKQKTYLWDILSFIKNERLCKYSLEEIPSPRNKLSNKEKEKISFEDWINIYNYCLKLDNHLNHAIVDKQYASLWLFIMILLTNAWRPSDVFRIPPIQPELIGVPNIEWFKIHNLTKPQAQKIINIIRSYNLVTAKNGMPRDFTCNLDLVIPMVTALCICEFHRRKNNSSSIIDFTSETKKKNTIRASHFNLFFEKSDDLKHIKFSPLIANRSLMEHLFYSIQEKKGKGNSAFELVMKLRKHKTEVTKEYIGYSENQISIHLFTRGEFGFLYEQLIELLTEVKESSLQERTTEISYVKQFFEPFEVENFFNFFSKVMSEQEQNLMDQLLSLSPDDALEHMRNMYLGQMPAKNPNTQCLIYPNCHRPSNQYSCNQCLFAVHNVYALTSIFNEFEDSIQRYKNSNKKGVKQREQNTIIKIQNLLIKTIDKFGEDYVFSFYDGGENLFMQKLALLEE